MSVLTKNFLFGGKIHGVGTAPTGAVLEAAKKKGLIGKADVKAPELEEADGKLTKSEIIEKLEALGVEEIDKRAKRDDLEALLEETLAEQE